MGGRMPLSSQLAAGVRQRLEAWNEKWEMGNEKSARCCAEMERLGPVLEIQARMSRVPGLADLLVERLKSREGWHLFFYPFEGRLAHEGLAALFAYRIARLRPLTFSLAVNDYGFELLSAEEAPLEEALEAGLLDEGGLTEDILGSVHSTEMARRRFREIARIAGLVVEGVGRARKSARAMTVSSSLLFDVFRKYDAGNLLLGQATREVLESELEFSRMVGALTRLRGMRRVTVDVAAATPLAYPLFVARLREQLSSEALADRVRRMEVAMEGV
jgi:ATP-dependent Lhr-like helicase